MVKDSNRVNNEYLWYAIVGMTSMYLEQKISKDMLNTLTQVYRYDASTRNVQGDRQKGSISVKMGYQLPLLDHWSLFESMLHSTYMMTHMHLWEEKGVDRLKEYIHRLGISLQDAKQLYKYMPKESQSKFESQIIPTSESFKLYDIVYTSFQRQLDYSASFMASDYYHILTAVLENPPRVNLNSKELTEYRIKCFWEAYDIFEGSLKEIGKRIEDGKRISRIMIS
jgi:cell division control protein 45